MITDAIISKAKTLKGRVQNLAYKVSKRMNWFDISRNLDTADCVDLEFLQDSIDSPNKEHGGRYVPTDLARLRKSLIALIGIDKTVLDHTVIDYGCGKGRVLIMAEEIGFSKVIGIEYSKKLCNICSDNLKKAKTKKVELVCADATEYKLAGDIRTFYFCNPFEYCIFEKVLENIKKFSRSTSQTGYIIYVDPRKFGRLNPDEYELLINDDGPVQPFHIYKVKNGT